MKVRCFFFSCAAIALAAVIVLTACATPQQGGAVRAPGRAPGGAAYWSGDGGQGASIAVFNMSSPGLSAEDQAVSLKVRSALVEAFDRFSAMDVMDMVALEQIIMDGESDFYADENEIIQMGSVVPSRYQLRGNIHRTAAGFAVQINVVQASNARQMATFNDNFLIDQIEDLSGIRRASSSLLEQMGVQLTAAGQESLLRPSSANQIHAHTLQSQGIVAHRGGNEIAALAHFIQAAHFDPTLAEAASRLNILEANITSGDMGADIRSDIEWRNQWVRRLQEAEDFFQAHVSSPPWMYIVYSDDAFRHMSTDFERRTVDFGGVSISALTDPYWFITINEVMRTVQDGLLATGRADAWGLCLERPLYRRTGGSHPVRVTMLLVNANGQAMGSADTTLLSGWERRGIRTSPQHIVSTSNIYFNRIDADLIIGEPVLRIHSIVGGDVVRLRRFSIMTEQEFNSNESIRAHGLDFPNLARFGTGGRMSWGSGSGWRGEGWEQRPGGAESVVGVRRGNHLPSTLIVPFGATTFHLNTRLGTTVREIIIPDTVHTLVATADNPNYPSREFATRITMPAGAQINWAGAASMHRGLSRQTREASFFFFYNDNPRAGTYTYSLGRWTWRP